MQCEVYEATAEMLFNEQHNSLQTSCSHACFIYYSELLVNFPVEYGLFLACTCGSTV